MRELNDEKDETSDKETQAELFFLWSFSGHLRSRRRHVKNNMCFLFQKINISFYEKCRTKKYSELVMYFLKQRFMMT